MNGNAVRPCIVITYAIGVAVLTWQVCNDLRSVNLAVQSFMLHTIFKVKGNWQYPWVSVRKVFEQNYSNKIIFSIYLNFDGHL